MKLKGEQFLNAPVAGMSLTAEPKSRPWRRPSEVSNVDEALSLYAPIFKNKKTTKMMLQQIENGVPLTTIADILTTANTMEGRHTLDVGVLLAPVLVETMITIAELAGVDYVVGNEERELPEERTELVNRAMRSIQETEEIDEESTIDEDVTENLEEVEPEEQEPTGLMARRSVS
mgnify:CR=1 FL=1|tara:strand:- start:1058 stop:1582 length:525 start_codon:yes stop_codon:yes gene_type:complete